MGVSTSQGDHMQEHTRYYHIQQRFTVKVTEPHLWTRRCVSADETCPKPCGNISAVVWMAFSNSCGEIFWDDCIKKRIQLSYLLLNCDKFFPSSLCITTWHSSWGIVSLKASLVISFYLSASLFRPLILLSSSLLGFCVLFYIYKYFSSTSKKSISSTLLVLSNINAATDLQPGWW